MRSELIINEINLKLMRHRKNKLRVCQLSSIVLTLDTRTQLAWRINNAFSIIKFTQPNPTELDFPLQFIH